MASWFAGLPPVAGVRAAGGPPSDVLVSLRMADGGEASFPLRPDADRHAGRWPFRVDPGDVSRVWFQDPADSQWHALRWEHADAVGGPFSSEALAYARQLATATHRFPDTRRALAELLEQRGAGLADNRAERRMALRLSEQRLCLVTDPPPSADPAEPAITGDGGDDDSDSELDAPFPGEESGDDPGDAQDGHKRQA